MSSGWRRTARREAYRLLSYVSPVWNTKLLYLRKFGKKIDLEHPKTLNEKISWLKLNQYGTDPLVRRCADKYAVRSYVEACGLSEIMNEWYQVCERPDEIRWEELPERFVIKWNFGCKFNLICKDKSKLSVRDAVRTLTEWGKKDFWAYYSELQYRNVPKRLLVERYLEAPEGEELEDYKFYCFHGHAAYVMVCCGREEGWPKFYFFDRNWKLARINKDSQEAPEGFTLPRPEALENGFEYADRLSRPFAFVRVDLYLLKESVVFGEMTFTPAAGLDKNRLPETDRMFGDLVTL